MDNTHLERMFDLVVHMRENPGSKYTVTGPKNAKVTLDYKQQARVLNKSIQAFFQTSGKMKGDKGY